MWWQRSEKKLDTIVQQYVTDHPNFTFIQFLGYGSYGRAYLIAEMSSQKRYVLKCLRPKHHRHTKTVQKFMQEIQIMRQLSLPTVPTFQMTGTIQNIPFFIMDYVDGQTFEELIFQKGQKFTVSQSLAITKQLLEQVVLLHEQGVVHRDLRIPNILLVKQQLYIVDFGLATLLKQQHVSAIRNPKKAENHISDLYFIGHFLLFLLYSNYTPVKGKEKPWQEELALPYEVQHFLERLLWIGEPFHHALDALQSIPSPINQ
ncbi:serine/threonine protein kinase [Lysinibacillus piscis]|uniref:Serine/threonine-protein kinase YbdM n=1 Tax=Lysinibacillus piscis TaxID=2518931 RepID=A0ABQ5NGY6_9BACI|nr:protein kinase family protein [Lysinibacillus sp. KH24]GLC87624.1 putative serine/threonine-protein kinase YbdM [Lysinibacillus sp. KH24]